MKIIMSKYSVIRVVPQSRPAQARNLGRRLALALGFSTALSAMAFGLLPVTGAAQADPVYVKEAQIPGFAALVAAVKPAVVSVQVKSDKSEEEEEASAFFGVPGFDQLPDDHPLKRFFRDFQEQRNFRFHDKGQKPRERIVSLGSGFFYSADGYVVTNNHVVDSGNVFSVTLDDGTQLDAKLVGKDPRTDLAVLKVNDKGRKFTYVGFADDNKMQIGDWVLAVGNPFGLGGTVTAGIISARGRDIGAGVYDDFIQIDAAVNRGNSGGPTFNLNGQVVGINTAIFSPSGGSVGIAFAIPASTAEQVVRQLIAKGAVERGWLGVQIQPVTKEVAESVGLNKAKGALIADPLDGPAAKAGIKAGNIIVSINGAEVADARDLARKIAAIRPDEVAVLGVWRNGKQENIKVKIAAQPNDKAAASDKSSKDKSATLASYGLAVAAAEDGRGVVIIDMDSDSEAAEKGARPGDIIRSINNRDIKTPAELQAGLNEAAKKGRSAVLLRIESDGVNHFITLSVQKK